MSLDGLNHSKHTIYFWSITIFLIFFFQTGLKSQESIRIKRLNLPVEFDGRPFEAAWDGLGFFPVVMHQPNFGSDPSEKTEVMVAYDDEYVWVGARLYMQDATKIVATSKKRDDYSLYSDSFAILFDSYNDKENGLVFYTMPSGLRTDYSVSSDAEMRGRMGGSTLNYNWNTYWDVKTVIDDNGWYLEMRIPFSSLKFKSQDGITTMGLIIRRAISANNEIATYPSLDPKHGINAYTKPSLAATIEFENIESSNPVYISPYVIGGFSRDWIKNTPDTEYIKRDKPDYNAGLDVKYNINSNLTLDLTANTDFAQVEADNQQVNLTRYSLFFPEKRMFFQERSSLFSFGLGGRSNLFYTRNIGLANGNPVRIYGGARIAGRIGKWDMGLLNMQTEEYNTTPGENFGVYRMRRQVINSNSFVGGIFTSRLGMNGAHNFAYGLDGIFRLFGVDYLDVKVAQTYDDKIANKINSVDPLYFSTSWERRSSKGLAYNLGYSYSGQKFNPGIGYVNVGSIQGISGGLSYGWLPGLKSKILSTSTFVEFSNSTRLEDGKLESMIVSPGVIIKSKSGYQVDFTIDHQKEGVLFDFPLSDSVWVRAGDYTFTVAQFNLRSPSSKPISAVLFTDAGEFYNGRRLTLTFMPVFNISSSLQLSGSYQFNHITSPDYHKAVDIHNVRSTVSYMLNTKLSVSLLVQYVSTTQDMKANLRLRYNPREGNDFYLVFNDYQDARNKLVIPDLPRYYNRTILLKYTHTFIL